jgi:hypothetical protein
MSMWIFTQKGANFTYSLYHELYHLTEGLSPTGDPYGMHSLSLKLRVACCGSIGLGNQ